MLQNEQVQRSNDHPSANPGHNQIQDNYHGTRQPQKNNVSSHSDGQQALGHAQDIVYAQDRERRPDNLSLLKGHNETPVQQQRVMNNQRPSHQSYPISPPSESRPPYHPNSLNNLQRQHQNFHSRTQSNQQNTYTKQQASHTMRSPPVLDQKQRVHNREHLPTNSFKGNMIYTMNSGQHHNDQEEGFEVEARQFTQHSPGDLSRGNPPTHETLMEDGYFDDEMQQFQVNNDAHNQQQQQMTNVTYNSPQQQSTNEVIESQPDPHQLNRNHLHQKKFAIRYQNAATNSSPKYHPHVQTEFTSSQLQRKQGQPSKNKRYELVQSQSKQQQIQPDEDESIASVFDRARSFEADYAPKYSNNDGKRRSQSVPRERAPIYNLYQAQNEMIRYQDNSRAIPRRKSLRSPISNQESHFYDDDTVTESVASRKKEWEGKFQTSQQKQKVVRQPPENESFGVWSERANRLARQRLHKQRDEQRRHRLEQRKNIEENWRRSTAKSMSPQHRQYKQEEQYDYIPVYSESLQYGDEHQRHMGRYMDQQSIGQISTQMSIEDRRRMLWDGKERLRAVLPRDSSFDSGNVNRPFDAVSPGTASGSQESFFKSKFVHAAANANHQRTHFEVNSNPSLRTSPKSHSPKSGAVSSHYTDSTAGTTPVDSYGSPRLIQNSSVSQVTDQHRRSSSEHNNQIQSRGGLPGGGSGETPQPGVFGSKVTVMPSIAEAPRSSVADLITRINAVNRSNPAEALAAIDSIIKAERSTPNSRNIPQRKVTKQPQSPFSHKTPSQNQVQLQPRANDFFQSKYEEVMKEGANIEDEDEEDESYSSSEDSTVSSMTNPTYQSIPIHNKLGHSKKSSHFSPPILEEFEVKSSKGARKNLASPQQRNQDVNRSASNRYSTQERQDQAAISKISSKPHGDTIMDRFIETTTEGSNQRVSNPKNSEHAIHNNLSKTQPISEPKFDNQLNSAWVPVHKNNFFHNGSINNDKVRNGPRQNISGSKLVKESQDKSWQNKHESKYLSDTELSVGQTTGLPSVVSDAFSGIDIDLEDEHASNSLRYRAQHDIASPGTVDLEQKKSVRQRREELEYLAQSWNQSQGDRNASKPTRSPLEKYIKSSAVNHYDWTANPDEQKKAKADPTLRLKGSKKLARKFANLVKAFESD